MPKIITNPKKDTKLTTQILGSETCKPNHIVRIAHIQTFLKISMKADKLFKIGRNAFAFYTTCISQN